LIAYNPAEPLISLHVPKTGGTSLKAVLGDWFPDGRLLLHYRTAPTHMPPRHDWHGPVCIHGHFNALRDFGVSDYYPQAAQFIVFLREPFDRFLSLWFYMNESRRRGGTVHALDDEPSFETWLHRRAAAEMQGRNDFGILCQLPRLPNPLDGGAVFDASFVFVGIMERYVESAAALAVVLGKPPRQLPHENASLPSSHDFERWRPFYEKNFAQEYFIYEKARLLNAAMIDAAMAAPTRNTRP
jgi:hypothetical protein